MKRLCAAVIFFILIIGLVGCGEEERVSMASVNGREPFEYRTILYPNAYKSKFNVFDISKEECEKIENYVDDCYDADFCKLTEDTQLMPYLVNIRDDYLYYVTATGESADKIISYHIMRRKLEGEYKEEELLSLSGEQKIIYIAPADDSFYLFAKSREESIHEDISEYFLRKYDFFGEEIWQKNITEYLTKDKIPNLYAAKQDERLRSMDYFNNDYMYSVYDITGAHVDKQGILYATNGRGLMSFNKNGEIRRWNHDNTELVYSNSVGMFFDRNDDVHVAYSSDGKYYSPPEGNTPKVSYIRNMGKTGKKRTFDMAEEEYVENIYLSSNVFNAGLNYDLLTTNEYVLYGCDFENRVAHKLLYWANAGVEGQYVDYMAELSDGRIIAISHCFDDKTPEAAVLKKTENVKEVLEVGVGCINKATQSAVAYLNRISV